MNEQSEVSVQKLKRLGNVHHAAYRCRDAEQTRWFYEDVLGLPLAAAMVFDEIPGSGRKSEYMHLFFQLADGNFIAFFDEPSTATSDHFHKKDSFDVHIAFEVESREAMLAYQKRINEAGKGCLGPVDHDFVESVYMYDPNGIQVEITSKTPDYDQIMSDDAAQAHDQLANWTARTRGVKEGLFGADALDQRGK
ncbi:MAG: VOC family protein [Gammaproteobacteria bacterium]|jgi:catechol 2,3-dioxygenase-like lactoylglutathione lyase family enzyme|nr:VOC family protein [Gammaproteobacteria bacterium]